MSKRAAAVMTNAWRLPKGELAALSDRDLIRRFVESGDQAAFAAVVRRHTGMVLGVCRRVLHSQADAEDATQAVFLLLAKKAKGIRWQASAANWLYATARKVAHNARLATVRRSKREGAAAVPESVPPMDAMTGRELVAALDEELDKLTTRYREPLVLCYLEGLTRDEAAARLGVPEPTLKSQLERGRKKLADALTARGCALGVALLATAATSSAGAPPSRLHDSILAAVGGHPSATAAALAQGVAVNGLWTKKLMLSAAMLAGVGLIGLGLKTASATDPPTAKDTTTRTRPGARADGEPVTLHGTVVGPDGKPVEGVAINTLGTGPFDALAAAMSGKPGVITLAKSDADGRFAVTLNPLPPGSPDYRQLVAAKDGFGPDWVNVRDLDDGPVSLKLADDVPVKGRVTDLEGKPVPKATVRVKMIAAGDLKRVWEMWPRDPYQALHAANREMWTPDLAGLPDSVTADADGKFEITGVGRGWLLTLVFEGAGIETAACRVVTDPTFDPKTVERPTGATMPGGGFRPGPVLYAPTFTHVGKPSQAVVGTVTDVGTGKPLAGVQVSGSSATPHWWENNATTKTEAEGKFRLTGVAKSDKVNLFVFAGEKSPYLSFNVAVSGQPGLTDIPIDLKMVRGVKVNGRIVEKGNGKPVVNAAVRYEPLADNTHYGRGMFDKRTVAGMAHTTDKDGRFEFTALPGSGVLLAQGETRGRTGTEFTQVRVAKADLPRADLKQVDSLGEAFSATDGHIIPLFSLSGYRIIDPKPEDEVVDVTIEFDRGKTVSGKLVDAAGRPATGVTAYKLTACYDYPQKLKDGTFTAVALDPAHPRTVLFADLDKKLAASVELKGDEKDVTLKLQPWGKLAGRLLDADGRPVAGANVSVVAKQNMKHMAFQTALRELPAATDADGKFALDVPAGPAEYLLSFNRKNMFLDTGFRPTMPGHMVKPGETIDVGVLKVKGE
jgi:RNA polymerase sigma factor (sigma-70 family)